MANTINIPDEAIPALITIANMEEPVFESLISIFAAEPPTLFVGQFAKKVSQNLKSVMEPKDVNIILGSIIPLFKIAKDESVSLAKLAEDISQSASNSDKLKFSPEKAEVLKNRIGRLFSLTKTLGVTAKASSIMMEQERTFCEAQIFSDVRSVFTEEPDIAAGAMVIHMFQVGYHQLGKHHDFYVAMDSNDLKKLKAQIETAEKREQSLKTMIEKSGVPFLGL